MRATLVVLLVSGAVTAAAHAQEDAVAQTPDESGAMLTPAPPPTYVVEPTPPGEPDEPTLRATTTTTSTPVVPAPETRPGDVPAPPPSYGGPPPAPAPSVPRPQTPALDPAVTAELAQLEAERRQLRIGGRVALMAAGLGGAAGASLLALNFAIEKELSTGCHHCGDNPGTILFSAVSIVAFGIGITGLILFIRRLRERKAIDRRMRELRLRGQVRPLALLEW